MDVKRYIIAMDTCLIYKLKMYIVLYGIILCPAIIQACTIGIVADDMFTAFIDGVTVAYEDSFAQQQAILLDPPQAQVLAIDVTNNNQASGLLVMTSPQFMFYSHGNNNAWRCRPALPGDTDMTWTSPDYDDTSWDYAQSLAMYADDDNPWSNYRNEYAIVDIRAEWIWTSNPGLEGVSELGTDTRIYCRVQIPQSCSNYIEPVYDPHNCEANGGRFVNSRNCIQYVPGSFTWDDARQHALANGGVLVPILDSDYQEIAQELMDSNNALIAWIGAKGSLQHNPNAWEWLPSCCTLSANTLELYDQGCYSESISDREFEHAVNLTGLPLLTATLCVEQCTAQGFTYAALQSGSECYCGDTFGARSVVPWCTRLCPNAATLTCGGFGANRIYRAGGVYSPWWLDFQPDNDQTDPSSTEQDYEYCATIALFRDTPQDVVFTPLGLADRLCSNLQHFACEVPSESTQYCDRSFTHNDVSRCLHINETLQLSWYQARQYCQSLDTDLGGGDLIVLNDDTVKDHVIAQMNYTSLNINQVWVGLTKNPWTWQDTGERIEGYNKFAASEPSSKLQECVAIDAASNYEWTTHSCTSATIYQLYGYIIMTAIPTTSTTTTSTTTTTTTTITTTPTTTASLTTTESPRTNMPSTPMIPAPLTTELTSTIPSTELTTIPVQETTSFETTTDEIPTTTTTTTTPTTTTIASTGGGGGGNSPQQSASKSNSNNSLSNTEIAIIVVVLLLILIIVIIILVFCYCKNKHKKVAPAKGDKYDARPQAILAYGGNLGETQGSVFTINSGNGSTAGLLAHSEMEYSLYPETSSRQGGPASNQNKIYIH